MSVKAVPKNTGSSDAEILARARVTITLAGTSYEWTETGRRQSRQMILEVHRGDGGLQGGPGGD